MPTEAEEAAAAVKAEKVMDDETAKDVDDVLGLSASDEDEEGEDGERAAEGDGDDEGTESEEEGDGKVGPKGDAREPPETEEEPRVKRAALPPFRHGEPPRGAKRTSAWICCIHCRLISTSFYDLGCPNCPNTIVRGMQETVDANTSKQWDGIISVINPKDSWARKWVRLGRNIVPGVYAMQCREIALRE